MSQQITGIVLRKVLSLVSGDGIVLDALKRKISVKNQGGTSLDSQKYVRSYLTKWNI